MNTDNAAVSAWGATPDTEADIMPPVEAAPTPAPSVTVATAPKGTRHAFVRDVIGNKCGNCGEAESDQMHEADGLDIGTAKELVNKASDCIDAAVGCLETVLDSEAVWGGSLDNTRLAIERLMVVSQSISDHELEG